MATLTHNLRSIEVQLTASRNRGLRYDHFQRVGHSLFAILAGLVGGTIAVGFWGEAGEGAPGIRIPRLTTRRWMVAAAIVGLVLAARMVFRLMGLGGGR